MTGVAAVTLGLWLVTSIASLWIWLPTGVGPAAALRESRWGRMAALAALVALAGGCAVLSAAAAPVPDPWRWVAFAVGATVTVLGGGAVTTSILALAGSAARATARVQRDVLRGGAWIGALERLALLGTLLAGWPEGLAVIVAIKGLARYPELRTSTAAGTGANERFIIGTLASLGWASICAWVLAMLL
jgi:hypothetical protein